VRRLPGKPGGRRWRSLVAGALDLPKDVVVNVPRVTVIGSLQVTVENHRGIVEFTPEKIRIACGEGAVEIRGENLALRAILPEEIVLDGRILAVSFIA